MVMPPHSHHRAPHHTPQPLVQKAHPAARSVHIAEAKHSTRQGQSHRATVIAGGNPATVQIHGSDATASWPVAANIDATTLSVGQAVVGIVFNPADPNDALLTGVY